MLDQSIAPTTEPSEKITPESVVITDLQRRLVHKEGVALKELPGLSVEAIRALNAAGVHTVKELIFFSNTGITKAFGGKGNNGTRRNIRRINTALCKEGFARRMSVQQYNNRIEELKRIVAKE